MLYHNYKANFPTILKLLLIKLQQKTRFYNLMHKTLYNYAIQCCVQLHKCDTEGHGSAS